LTTEDLYIQISITANDSSRRVKYNLINNVDKQLEDNNVIINDYVSLSNSNKFIINISSIKRIKFK